MKPILRIFCLFFLPLISLTHCASIPGDTGEEQAEAIDALVDRTLADLYQLEPEAKEKIDRSVGYAIMKGKITKVPMVGAGSGYGVAIDNKTADKTYLQITELDIGGGWGARSVRLVIIFQDEKKFRIFIAGVYKTTASAEASAKVKNKGTAGRAGSDIMSKEKGYSVHFITDAGASATFTVGVLRVKPIELKHLEIE